MLGLAGIDINSGVDLNRFTAETVFVCLAVFVAVLPFVLKTFLELADFNYLLRKFFAFQR